jgi:glucose/mannose-6-phosphate isomerase
VETANALDLMENYILNFPDNLMEGLKVGRQAARSFKTPPIDQVIFLGMGGSGIGGKLVSDLLMRTATTPITVVNDYDLRAWINSGTLVVACSYSGYTEETLTAIQEAISKEADITCITSGGKLELIASEKDFNLVKLPSGQPPRTSFGYNSMEMLTVMEAYGVIEKPFLDRVPELVSLLKREQVSMRAEAAVIAKSIKDSIPVIYSPASVESVALRLRQQINENAKMLCWHHSLPEMNHNELVGWAGGNDQCAGIFIQTPQDRPEVKRRIEFTKELISRYTSTIVELHPKGSSRLEQVYYLIHLCDWISYYLAVERKVDPIEIEVIDELKKRLRND